MTSVVIPEHSPHKIEPLPGVKLIKPPTFLKQTTEKVNPRRIVIGGSSANPTHLDHHSLLEDIRFSDLDFGWLIWIPCGERPDKHFAVCSNCLVGPDDYCHICTNHRIAMTEMTVGSFRQSASLPYFSIWYDDVFGQNTPTIVWLQRLVEMYPQAEITWVTGADSVVPQERFGGKNEIQAQWQEGEELWQSQRWKWLIFRRAGYSLEDCRLPDNAEVRQLTDNHGTSSSLIRSLIASGNPLWETMVATEVADYIKQWRLYGYKEKSCLNHL